MKEKGNVAVVVVFAVLLGALAFFYFRSSLKDSVDKLVEGVVAPVNTLKPAVGSAPKAALSPTSARTKISADIAKYPGAYKTQANSDLSTDVFYQGEVGTVTENPNNTLAITLKTTRGDSAGTTITISMPKIPAANGAKILGNNFKEMVNKGIKVVNIRIRYSQSNQFIEWELI